VLRPQPAPRPLAGAKRPCTRKVRKTCHNRDFCILPGGVAAGGQTHHPGPSLKRAVAGLADDARARQSGIVPRAAARASKCISRWVKDAVLEWLPARETSWFDGAKYFDGAQRRAELLRATVFRMGYLEFRPACHRVNRGGRGRIEHAKRIFRGAGPACSGSESLPTSMRGAGFCRIARWVCRDFTRLRHFLGWPDTTSDAPFAARVFARLIPAPPRKSRIGITRVPGVLIARYLGDSTEGRVLTGSRIYGQSCDGHCRTRVACPPRVWAC